MQYIIGVLLGIICGMGIAGLMARSEINKRDRKIANQNAMIRSRDDLIDRQRNQLSAIKAEINKQQFGSVENLQNKIKSILFNDHKSEK